MQTYHLKPDEVTVMAHIKTGKKAFTIYRAYQKGSSKVLASICFRDGATPTVEITNVGISLERRILLLGYITKVDSNFQLIGTHGTMNESIKLLIVK